jgi:hypothetical protein
VPNPFNPITTLGFGVSQPGPLTIDVYDARGHRVRGLLRLSHATPGIQRVRWDGMDDAGARVASGVYVVRMQTGGTVLTRRVTLLK